MNMIYLGGFFMCKNVDFNVIEKYKNKETQEISKYVNAIINKLIATEFSKSCNSLKNS